MSEDAPRRPVVASTLSAAQARDLLHAIIEATPLAIYAKDASHRFVISNRQHAVLTGRPAEEILGRTDAELFGAEGESFETVSRRVLAEGEPVAQEFQLTLPDGSYTFLETIFPIADGDGRPFGVGGIAADLTARRRLEDALAERARELETALTELRALQEQLVRQQKMAALGALVAGVAHEVSTPLGVALTASSLFEGYVSELESLFGERRLTRAAMSSILERMRQASTLTVKNVDRAARLLHAFKQVAADRSQRITRTGTLGAWLDDVILSLSPALRTGGVRAEARVEVPTPVVFAASELQQIVTNLVMNAVVHAFTDGGDDDATPIALPPAGDRVVRVSLCETETGIALTVRDNGRGMTPTVAARAFDPFFTTRRGRGGTGLGLHVTHAIVAETFGGAIDLDTEPGRGACFTVTIPWRAGTLARAATAAAP